ncbi:MAG: pyrroloquinoline quinone biosynthesis peptide chaperone PqqD [Labilithrix sp.]
MTLALDFVPKLAKKARLRFDRHSGKHMLVYPERGLELNESAAAIVKRCDGSKTVSAIVEELSKETGADVKDDVIAVIDDLRKKGLFE